MNLTRPILTALLFAALPLHAAGNLSFEPTTFKPSSAAPVAAEIGTLTVPENRRTPSDHTIKLKFLRFRSTSKHPGSPIVYLAGGPGGSGIDAAKDTRFPLFMALREFGDVIAFDQRGTGTSEPSTRCTESYMLPFDAPLDRAQAEAILAAGMKQCFERLRAAGIDANAYNTAESADDLDALRQALGADKITLWGLSYGSHLGLAALRAHGAHIDRAILAGIEPLDQTLKLPSDQQALLQRISDLAKRDPAIAKKVPDLMAAIGRVLARLQREPARVTLVHPASGQSIEVVVGALDLQVTLAGMLTGPQTFAAMPDMVSRLDGGDWTALALQSGLFRMGRLMTAMSVAMDCASGTSRERLLRIETEAKTTLLGDAINLPFLGICQGLDVADLGEEFRAPVRSDVPVLLISGTLDGRTPQRNAELVMQGLPNAQHLVIDGAGHSDPLFLSSPKILDAMKSFLRTGKAGVTRTVATSVPFLPVRAVVDVPDEILARYAGSYRIEGDEVRRLVKAGSLLYTVRGDGPPYPLRAMSRTEFFWEGMPGRVRFDVAPDGKVLGMELDPDGTGKKWLKSPKVD